MTDDHLVIDVESDGAQDLTLLLTGELDIASAGTLRGCLASIDRQCRNVTIDLTGLTFVDSTGISVLIEAHERCESEMRQLTLSNPSGHVTRVIELLGIAQVIPIAYDHPTGEPR